MILLPHMDVFSFSTRYMGISNLLHCDDGGGGGGCACLRQATGEVFQAGAIVHGDHHAGDGVVAFGGYGRGFFLWGSCDPHAPHRVVTPPEPPKVRVTKRRLEMR